MQFSVDDTIAAIASARGGAWRGILRVSGPRAAECVDRCFAIDSAEVARLGDSLAGVSRATVVAGRWRLNDSATLPGDVYWWPGERSYTRQPTVEFHTIGSPPLLDLALAAACAAGARLARPGEFTLRAFLAGRLDLTQAEAVLGVIDARGPSELDAALGQLAGGLAAPLRELRERLLNLLAHVEAGLDFVSEDIEFITVDELQRELSAAVAQVTELASQMESRGRSGEEPRVVLIGRPNTGKSSLLNALCGEQAAIVADVPGTTRDYVARRATWDGVSCELIDTAGLDEFEQATSELSAGQPHDGDEQRIEQAAQRQSLGQRRQAAVELLCLDATRPCDAWELRQLRTAPAAGTSRLVVRTKLDALPSDASIDRRAATDMAFAGATCVATSSATGQGLDELRSTVVELLRSRAAGAEGVVAATASRCRESVRRAAESLRRAQDLVPAGMEDLLAGEVRLALEDLGEVAGVVYTDDVLDRIFSRFCIGK